MKRVLDKETILQLLSDREQELKGMGVKQIGLFGSYVRNEASAGSDIDLLVDIEAGKKTFRNFMNLAYYLDNLFGQKVELVTRQSLSPYIGPHILKTVSYAPFAS